MLLGKPMTTSDSWFYLPYHSQIHMLCCHTRGMRWHQKQLRIATNQNSLFCVAFTALLYWLGSNPRNSLPKKSHFECFTISIQFWFNIICFHCVLWAADTVSDKVKLHSIHTRWRCCTHWNLAGQREAARAFLFVVGGVVGASTTANGAATWHLTLPSFVWSLSWWLSCRRVRRARLMGTCIVWRIRVCFYLCCAVGLPGGATILCHFWKRQVLRQSLGLRLYVLCLDISSCMGSKITHSWRREQQGRMLRDWFRSSISHVCLSVLLDMVSPKQEVCTVCHTNQF